MLIVITQTQKKTTQARFCKNLLGGCVVQDAFSDSVTTLENGFEPIIHETSNDARDDSFDALNKHAHRYHPLSVNNFKVEW